jgi:hypothetical protein
MQLTNCVSFFSIDIDMNCFRKLTRGINICFFFYSPSLSCTPGSGLYVGQGVDWQNVTQVRHLSRFSATAPNPFDFPVLNPFNATDGRLHITDAGLGSFGSTPVLPMLLPSRDVKVPPKSTSIPPYTQKVLP